MKRDSKLFAFVVFSVLFLLMQCGWLYLTALGQSEIIIDNEDPQTVITNGSTSWGLASTFADSYGDDYRFLNQFSDGSSSTFRWEFTEATTGTYDIYMWWPTSTNDPNDDITTIISHQTGVITTSIDQTQDSGQWNLIGQYDIVPQSYIQINNSTGGREVADAVRLVNVTVDTTPPVITLLGNNPMTVTVNSVYNEPGATATDDIDGDISGSIVVSNSNVATDTIGSYNVTYNVTDAASNAAAEKTRIVNVVSGEAPIEPCSLINDPPIGAITIDDYDAIQSGWDTSTGDCSYSNNYSIFNAASFIAEASYYFDGLDTTKDYDIYMAIPDNFSAYPTTMDPNLYHSNFENDTLTINRDTPGWVLLQSNVVPTPLGEIEILFEPQSPDDLWVIDAIYIIDSSPCLDEGICDNIRTLSRQIEELKSITRTYSISIAYGINPSVSVTDDGNSLTGIITIPNSYSQFDALFTLAMFTVFVLIGGAMGKPTMMIIAFIGLYFTGVLTNGGNYVTYPLLVIGSAYTVYKLLNTRRNI